MAAPTAAARASLATNAAPEFAIEQPHDHVPFDPAASSTSGPGPAPPPPEDAAQPARAETRHEGAQEGAQPVASTSSAPDDRPATPPPPAAAGGSTGAHATAHASPSVSGLGVTTLTPSSRANPKSSSTPRRVGPGGVAFLPAFSPADTACAFCGGDCSVNKHGRGEDLVSCYECGSSGHPTCLEWDDWGMVKRVKGYAWLCQECKRCEVCDEKGDDVRAFFSSLFSLSLAVCSPCVTGCPD